MTLFRAVSVIQCNPFRIHMFNCCSEGPSFNKILVIFIWGTPRKIDFFGYPCVEPPCWLLRLHRATGPLLSSWRTNTCLAAGYWGSGNTETPFAVGDWDNSWSETLRHSLQWGTETLNLQWGTETLLEVKHWDALCSETQRHSSEWGAHSWKLQVFTIFPVNWQRHKPLWYKTTWYYV